MLTLEINQSINQSINQYSYITGMPERKPNNRIIYSGYRSRSIVQT